MKGLEKVPMVIVGTKGNILLLKTSIYIFLNKFLVDQDGKINREVQKNDGLQLACNNLLNNNYFFFKYFFQSKTSMFLY